MKRLGIFGGSFDPIHIGHLWLAETACEQLGLDKVRFVPAAQSPLKQDQPPIEARHRLEMVKLAISGNSRFELDDRELRRSGVSYTIDTLEEIHVELSGVELYLIIGADSLNEFARWKQPADICRLATLATAIRGGASPPDYSVLQAFATTSQIETIIQSALQMPIIELSSRELRDRASKGLSLRYRTPAAVAAYIGSNRLYFSPETIVKEKPDVVSDRPASQL